MAIWDPGTDNTRVLPFQIERNKTAVGSFACLSAAGDIADYKPAGRQK
jgi:hypothetical protein